jgi:alpha-tubulin suppressor-like RCC1 family protein
MGNGTVNGPHNTAAQPLPAPVVLPAGVSTDAVAAGEDFGLAVGSDGNAYAWGDNSTGELGDGTTTPRPSPVTVVLPAGVGALGVSAGGDFSLVLGSDGKVYAAGGNFYGELGNRTQDQSTTPHPTPAPVAFPAGVSISAVSAGAGENALAISSGGQV